MSRHHPPARSRRRVLHPVALAAAAVLAMPGLQAHAADYAWTAGNLSAQAFAPGVTLNDTLLIGCTPDACGSKTVDQPFSSTATITATDTLYFQYAANTFSNGWTYALQGDVGLVNSYAGGSFVNEATGTLVKTAGSGDSVISISLTSRGGSLLDTMAGSVVFTAGTASFDTGAQLKANSGTRIAFTGGTASFAQGVRFFGDGLYEIGTNASFGGDVGAAQWAFTNGNYTGGDGSGGGGGMGSQARLVTSASWTGNGSLQGSWAIAAGTTLAASGAGSRYIRGSVSNDGLLRTDDGSFYFEYAAYGIDNRGRIELHGDGGLVNAYAGGTLVNSGMLAKVAGSGTSLVSGINVSNSGVIDARSGTLQFSGGTLDFAEGSRFTGAGTVLVSSNARFAGRIDTQNLVLANAGFDGGDGGGGANLHPLAELHGRTRWTGGSLNGQWQLAADHTLTVDGGGNHYIRGSVVNLGRVAVADNLYLEYTAYSIDNRGTLDLQGDIGLVNVYAGGTLVNSGTVLKSAGSGSSVVSGINGSFTANSLLHVQSGALQFSGATTRFDSGAVLRVDAGSTLLFSGGQTTFAAGTSLQGAGLYMLAGDSQVLGSIAAQRLVFGNGTHTGGDGSAGSSATLASDATWTGSGALQGSWQIAAGSTLGVQGDGNRTLRGSLRNDGTLRSDSTLSMEYASYGIDNRNRMELQGDVGLVNVYAGGTLLNSGTVAKTAGSGTSLLRGINVGNSGTFDVQTGTLEFSGGTLDFADGTRFTGAGTVLVSSAAHFSGRIDAQQLVLRGAAYDGGNGAAQPAAELHGNTRWAGGQLTGQWTLAADHTLAVEAGAGSHTVRGSVVNLGRIVAGDNLYFEYASDSIDNRGTLDLQGDVGLLNAYAGGTLVNSGRLVKSAGSGESSLAGISVSNTGSIDVQTGTLRLPGSFANDGVLMGSGRIATSGTLANAGRIAPGGAGLSVASLTLDSHLLLGSTGTLALDLQTALLHDLLLVNGDVTLGGTLALSCHGSCSFAAGSNVLLLDGSGSLGGAFAGVTLDGFAADDVSVVVDTANADVWLHIEHDITAAVPEPDSWALMLGGLGLVGWLGARRRAAGRMAR